jgi:hypothetical protein
MDPQTIWSAAEAIPPEWYGGDTVELEQLVEALMARRARVRELIDGFRESHRMPFPHWGRAASEVLPAIFAEPFPKGEWGAKTGAGKLVMYGARVEECGGVRQWSKSCEAGFGIDGGSGV